MSQPTSSLTTDVRARDDDDVDVVRYRLSPRPPWAQLRETVYYGEPHHLNVTVRAVLEDAEAAGWIE